MGMMSPLLSLPPFAQEMPDVVTGIFGVLSETILGIVLILVILGYLWAKPSVEALKEENRNLREDVRTKDEELASLRRSIEKHVIPSIEKNAHVAERVVNLIDEQKDLSRTLIVALEGRRGP